MTAEPGLYVIGLHFLRRRKSAFIDGVGDDAAALASHMSAYVAGACPAVGLTERAMMISPAHMESRYDIVVVGARPAGAGTALLLARQGARVLMIDRGRTGTDTLSTHALMRGGVLQLARWGVLPRIVAAGTPPVRQATFIYGDDALAVAVKPRDGVDGAVRPAADRSRPHAGGCRRRSWRGCRLRRRVSPTCFADTTGG